MRSPLRSLWTLAKGRPPAHGKKFPRKVVQQLIILSLCRIAEPIAMTSIFPYLYYMIQSFGVPRSDISFYAGLTAASFSFAQVLTGLVWGRVSDVYGRKPLILFGLTATMLSFLLFGFATHLWMAIAARVLAGLVNGNVGILRTVVAELVTEPELQPRAFSIMPIIWNLASVLGPMVGGALADPARNHREWWGDREPGWFWYRFPYALPNIVCAAVFVLGIPIGWLFLEETLETRRGYQDAGLRVGRRLVAAVKAVCGRGDGYKAVPAGAEEAAAAEETAAAGTREDVETAPAQEQQPTETPPLLSALTPQSTLQIAYYLCLAIHTITYDQLLPVLLAYPPVDRREFSLPFRFWGGLGMAPSEIGRIFAFFGFLGMLLQLCIFPRVALKLGALPCLRIVSLIFPVCYALVPAVLLFPPPVARAILYTSFTLKTVAVVFAFPLSTMLITSSAPSLRVLGTLNGIATATAAFGRTIGPAGAGWLFAVGQRQHVSVVPWAVVVAIAVAAVACTVEMRDLGARRRLEEEARAAAGRAREDGEETRLLGVTDGSEEIGAGGGRGYGALAARVDVERSHEHVEEMGREERRRRESVA